MKQFKDQMSRWYTIGIFKELSGNKDTVLFTIDEARKLYLECADITGYTFATKYLGGWRHWIALHASPKVEPLIKEWEEELEVKMRASAIKNITALSVGEKGYQAAKFLADRGWQIKTAGRTTKEAIKKEARVQSKMYDEFEGNIIKIK